MEHNLIFADLPSHVKVNKTDIRYLVFQGGSVKGIGYVGAYQALLDAGISLQQIEGIAGTSAGAITALLLSLNYTVKEMDQLMQKLDFKTFLDQDKVDIRDTLFELKDKQGSSFWGKLASKTSDSTISKTSSILTQSFGLFKGEVFRKWAEERLKEKTGIDFITFAELHALKQQHPDKYKDLFVVGVNANTNEANVFSWKNTPHVIVSDAVRISMSIPFIFMPHQRYMKAGKERKLEPGYEQQLYIDGGVTDNYPLFIFDHYEFLPKTVQQGVPPGTKYANPTTLGFRLVNKEKRDYLLGNQKEAPAVDLLTFLPYFKAVLSSIYNKQESDHVLAQDQWRTVYIDTCGINMLDFDLTDQQKAQLITSGKEAVDVFFNFPVAAPSAHFNL